MSLGTFAFPRLNEVQFPKELQRRGHLLGCSLLGASMKCSSRRNCNSLRRWVRSPPPSRLNEVQFPKELQPARGLVDAPVRGASMKCSSRRNCNLLAVRLPRAAVDASMKCSSRRNCNSSALSATLSPPSLNEVQFPKELQPGLGAPPRSSRCSLNEVQFPKELQQGRPGRHHPGHRASMKCSSRRNCDTNRYTAKTLQVQPQ